MGGVPGPRSVQVPPLMTVCFVTVGKEDKKAIDYMKARYEGEKEKQGAKLIREPKKLDHQWEKYETLTICYFLACCS